MNTPVIGVEEDGWIVVGDEAFFPDEYEQLAKTCIRCGTRFMLITDEGNVSWGTRSSYCSDECCRLQRNEYERDRRRAA